MGDNPPAIGPDGGQTVGIFAIDGDLGPGNWSIAPDWKAAENTATVLTVSTPFTDGDGTLTITVWYSIEDVP